MSADQAMDPAVAEALDLAARDRDQLLERLKQTPRSKVTDSGRIILGPSLNPTRDVRQTGRWRWAWKVTDHLTGDVLATGRSLREPWAWHQAERAADRIYVERLAVTVR